MNIQEARQRLPELAGLSDESALNVIHEVYYPDMDKATLGARLGLKLAEPTAPERSTLRAMGDTAIHFGRGAVSGVRMMSDLAGADNKVSAGLRSADQAMGELLSATAKQDQQRIAEIMQEAEGKGWGEQIVAGLKAAGVAPGALLAQAAGTTLPTLAVAAIPGAGPAAAAARLGAAGAIGAGQGAGNIKGQIYETTKAKLLQAGLSEAEADARAVQAQAYDGQNAGQIAMGGALGAAAGSTGAERAVSALRNGVTKSPAGLVGRVVQGGLAEAVPEALQGGQEKYATNTALNNEGFQVDPWSGVVAQGTMEGVAGLGMGAATGLPAPRVHADAIRATEKVPESGPLSRAANAGVEARAQAVEATGVDPTAPVLNDQQQEPVDDPMVDRIKALPAGKRTEALRAYAVLNRDGLAKGVVQYNRKLLDRLLAENDGDGKADPAPEPSGPLLLGYDQTPTGVMLAGPDGVRPEGRADVVNRTQELDRQRDLGLTPDVLRAPRSQATPEPTPQAMAPEMVEPPTPTVRDATEPTPIASPPQMMGAFSTAQDAAAYISTQRRSGGSRFQALPLPMDDGSFGVATAESPDFPKAEVFRVKQEREAAGILEGDTLNKQGQPFKTKASAVLAAKKLGGEAVPVTGGFVVRKPTHQMEATTNAIDQTPAPAVAAVEPQAAAPVVDSMAAPAVDAQPEPVAALNDGVREVLNRAYRVASALFGKDIYAAGVQRDWQSLLDAIQARDLRKIEDLRQKYKKDMERDGLGSGTSGAGPGKVKQARPGAAQLGRFAFDAEVAIKQTQSPSADVTNTETQPAAQAEALPDQAPAPADAPGAAEPAELPGAGGGAVEAAGVKYREAAIAAFKRSADEQMPGRDHQRSAEMIADRLLPLIEAKNADAIRAMNLGSADMNPGSRAAFEAVTGIRLPKGRAATERAIDEWAGITEQQRAATDAARTAEREAARAKRETESARKYAASIQVKDGDRTVDGASWVDGLMSNGFTKIVRRGPKGGFTERIPKTYLANDAGNGWAMGHKDIADYARKKSVNQPATTEPLSEAVVNVPKDVSEAIQGQMRKQKNRVKKRLPAAEKAYQARIAKLKEYFAPGNIVKGYIGHDRVLQFREGDGLGNWSVQVESVRKDGERWVPVGKSEPPRWHATQPTAKELQAGPVQRAAAPAAPPAPKPVPSAAPILKPASKTPIIDAHTDLFKAVRSGTATPEEFKAMYAKVRDGKAAIFAELNTSTKDELLKGVTGYLRPGTTKVVLVEAIYKGLLNRFALGKEYGPSSYVMGQEKAYEKAKRDAFDALVDGQTAESLAQYAAELKAEFDEVMAAQSAKLESIKDPKTLDDFRSFVSYHMREGKTQREIRFMLPPKQRALMDELMATETRSKRTTAKEEQRTAVSVAGQVVDGEIIATKHTKKGTDLFVVRLAERVSREDYETLNAGAKRIGGYYSSFRGSGAVPGFQFTTREQAQAFVTLDAGDNTAAMEAAKERRDAFQDDRSQTAAERLNEMAGRLEDRADESLGRERKDNTARRARFAAGAEAAAQSDKALAKTMRNIADAITGGTAKFLDRVRQKVQVELLQGYVLTAKDAEIRAQAESYMEQERRKGEPPTAETADHAEFPQYIAYRSDLASIGRQLQDVDGTKKLGDRLMKVADDVSDAFTAWAKEPGNLFNLSTFSVRQGEDVRTALFTTKEMAERAIKRSGLVGKAIAFQEKRGVHRVIMSPSEAIAKGVWKGDGDKRITLSDEFGAELVEAIGRASRRGSKVSVPWQFEATYDRRKTLARMGIETPPEFRSALREFIGLREQPAEADKIKAMERAMIGRRNDGLDFFPTPAETADAMVDAAAIEPGMRVLEPSAGMGHIADRIRAAGHQPDVIEIESDKRELLEAKGHNLQRDRDFLEFTDSNQGARGFTYGDLMDAPDGTRGILRGQGGMGSDRVRLMSDEADPREMGKFNFSDLVGVERRGVGSGYDRILMNPPFSDGRDIQHVRHAYDLLKPGGRLVALMGESAFTNQNKRATEFREWLESIGGTDEKLAEGTFNDPSLPVNTVANARMVVIEKPGTGGSEAAPSIDDGEERTMFSRSASTADEQALDYISQQSDVFSLPKSAAKDLESIIAENMPGLTFKKSKFGDQTVYKFTLPDGTPADMSVRPPNPYGPVLYGWDKGPDGEMTNIITERPGENAEEMDGKTDVWIDVSKLKSGELGQSIYNIAATYAHNNGMVFIGDPNGLSDIALRRRTENMLNSALKFGTTEHLWPHPRQADGDKAQGVPPLRWVYGDHVGNIERMIDVSVRSAQNADYVQPAADYIPASEASSRSGARGRLVDSNGSQIGRRDLQAAAEFGPNREAGIGRRTLARLAIFESLLQRAGQGSAEGWRAGSGEGILARFAGIVREFAVAEPGSRIFYSRGDSSSGLTIEAAQASVDSITSKWANAPEIVVVQDMQDSRVPEQARLDNAAQQSQNAEGDPEGFYLGGKVYVVAGALKSEADVARVVFHEALGHAGLRGVFGDGLTPILQQIAALRGADMKAKAKQYGIDASTKEGRLDAAEEVLAEMAQTRPELGFVRRAVAAIRSWLRANVPGLAGLKLTDAEIVRDYLIPARGFIERGRAAAGEVPTVAGGGSATRYSRSLSTAFSDGLNNVRDLNLPAGYKVNDLFQSKGKLHWWHKTVGTQYNLAQRSPEFKPVFDTAQNFINDVAHYASTAADQAPKILPKLEDLKDIAKSPLSAADNKAIAAPIFEGTLVWTRDADGKPVKVDPASDAPAGIVFTPDELRSLFKLTDEQVVLYQEFRAAADMSLSSMAVGDIVRFGGKDLAAVREQLLEAETVEDATQLAVQHLDALAEANPSRAEVLRDTAERIQEKADKARDLMDRGYAPLTRYGQHSLDVVDANGERVYFGLFESRAEANKMARQMKDNFPDAEVSQGTMSQEEYKLFSGVSPETVELFGDMLGLEATGDGEADQAFQSYLKLAKANRSAMKRLIHRKGIAGFSEDPGRVLAGFVYSNARQTSSSLHMGQLTEAVAAIPKGQGELKDAAVKLRDYVQNPQEEAQAFRGLLFAQYLGGSIASAIVNTTQPLAVTFPWLSQYGGVAKAAGQMRLAVADALKKTTGDADLDAALKDAEESGIVSPQEVFQLQAQAAGRAPLRAGDGTIAGNAMAAGSNALSKFSLAWGKLFGVAEQFNRRTTFIAAYRTAVEQGMSDPAAFAEKAIYETQFIYCVDSETECLTTSGWKRRDQLSVGDMVIGVDANGAAVETPLKAVHKFDGRREVTEYSNATRFSMVVTDGHRHFIQNYNSRDKKWQTPIMPTTAELRDGHHLVRAPLRAIERDGGVGVDMAALLGWIAAEGHYARFRNCQARTNVRLVQSIHHNPEYVAEIDALLDRLGGHYKKFIARSGEMATYTLKRPLSDAVRLLMPEKLLTWELTKAMSAEEMLSLIDAFAKGDGHKVKDGGWIIAQKQEQNLEVLHAMAAMVGQNATLYPGEDRENGRVPHLYLHTNTKRTMVKQLTKVNRVVADGVWCPETESGTWIARRNGAMFVTGNSKANKPRWARGAIGGTLFTFKQYSVNYMELLHRMATQGGPEGKRAALLALGVLFLLSGAGGLPFAEDVDDLIDGAMQRMGYNFSSKQAKQEFFTNIFGQAGAQFVMRGVSGTAGVPIDVSGRFGMQNLIPGTGALLKKEDRTRDLMELAGPAGDFAKRIFEGGEKLMAGDVLGPRGAVVTVLPLAMRNVAKAHEMATTGMYLDTKGRKVIDADGFDAAAKAIGFQPNDVARVQDATFEVQRRIGLNKIRESEIAGKWAKGVFLGDQDLVQEARAEIKAWNDNNPDAPIRIQMPQITRRVREMRTSKQDRIAKTAPKEIRDQVKRELARELPQ
ncbi:MAG: PLxRFG domain-containing protein [Rhizobacter sp.]